MVVSRCNVTLRGATWPVQKAALSTSSGREIPGGVMTVTLSPHPPTLTPGGAFVALLQNCNTQEPTFWAGAAVTRQGPQSAIIAVPHSVAGDPVREGTRPLAAQAAVGRVAHACAVAGQAVQTIPMARAGVAVGGGTLIPALPAIIAGGAVVAVCGAPHAQCRGLQALALPRACGVSTRGRLGRATHGAPHRHPKTLDTSRTPTPVLVPATINTTQHNTTQHNTTQHNTTQHNTTQHNTTQHNTTQHNTTQHNTTQHDTTQHDTTRHDTKRHDTTQHNTQHTTHNTQHTTKQHRTTLRMYWLFSRKAFFNCDIPRDLCWGRPKDTARP